MRCEGSGAAPLLVTATPVQNSVDDLRSLLELANAVPEKASESILREALRTRTLRRSVHESPLNLPPLRRMCGLLPPFSYTKTGPRGTGRQRPRAGEPIQTLVIIRKRFR